jgi:hypothetical protein
MRRTLLLLLTLAGCGDPDVLQSLPAADRARWNRCLTPIRQANGCYRAPDTEAGLTNMMLDESCLKKKAPKTEYAGAVEQQRRKWLLDHGCPPGVLDAPAR